MNRVDLWLADLDRCANEQASYEAVLSSDELSRRRCIRLERVRNHSIVSRGVLRFVLADHLGCAPSEVQIELEPLGKPYLGKRHADDAGRCLHFNVSHSDGLLAIAIDPDQPIGVDLERVREMDTLDAIAAQLYSAEQNELLRSLAAKDQLRAFFRYWTHREAVTKALGCGLLESIELQYSSPLDNLCADELLQLECVSRSSATSMSWSLMEFSPRDGYTGCIAVAGSCRQIQPQWF